MVDDEFETFSGRQLAYGPNIIDIQVKWKTTSEIMPAVALEKNRCMAEQDLIEGHLLKRNSFTSRFAKLVRCKEVDLFDSIFDIVEKTGDFWVEQWFSPRYEYLPRPEVSYELYIELMYSFGHAFFIQFAKPWILAMGRAPGTLGIARKNNLQANVVEHDLFLMLSGLARYHLR
jgi:hypothetical protein